MLIAWVLRLSDLKLELTFSSFHCARLSTWQV